MTTDRRPAEPPYRLVATDLDGTLLRDDDTISPRTRRALAEVTALGAAHIVVTGRGAPWAKIVLDDLGYDGLAVCGQGSQVYHAGRHELLSSVTLDRRLGALALSKLEAEVGPLAVAASRDGIAGEVVVGPGYRLRALLPVVHMRNPEELWATPVIKLYVQHAELDDDALAEAAREVVGDLVGVTHAGPGIVELLPPGMSKAVGLAMAAELLGIAPEHTIAFGDMPNDVPMFAWAGHGVAMGNAHAELRAAADEVTASNNEDGIALVLERLFGVSWSPDAR
ncbi:HAD family hydrolase [Allostreptomyces psammosilenae]|uniref:Hydrolase n=1 Tax=Allostreptomyces psammosilenae TaxID=1892865 RepID=A0A852ZW51_9ACTN|nr:HAD family hydrolase [Allostreptomyces psammosilenae]NYI05480.1 hypothetical protein [Allostreptomyces psammosilenae]